MLFQQCQWSNPPAGHDVSWVIPKLLGVNETPTYAEMVTMCEALAASDDRCTLHEIGVGDCGRPILALVLSTSLDQGESGPRLDGVRLRLQDGLQDDTKVRILVNNAIHPGEPCGVNASLALAAEWLSTQDSPNHPLRSMDWVFIPQYNVGGALRRNCCTRANQQGPEAYGFRGNAQNLDLNRDFIKMDSRNAEAFVSLFHAVEPHVFVDTHTSNGADYPYTMTLITTQEDKAGPVMGPFLRNIMEPALYQGMEESGWPMVPYVYSLGETPSEGIRGFLETPRYSTGYAVLWGAIGFTTEAHMLKPFEDRVEATMAFLETLSAWLADHSKEVRELKSREQQRLRHAKTLPVRWGLAPHQPDSIAFTGYVSRREWSAVTQGTRLRYDTTSTWTRDIPFHNRYDEVETLQVPEAWILPQAWRNVATRLLANGIEMTQLPADTTMLLEVCTIEAFQSSPRPYEGHHPLTIDSVRKEVLPVALFKGDWVIPADQQGKRYLAEVLSPLAHDAFLVWNGFDAALQRKEYYSDYVFEDTAEEMLKHDAQLMDQFQAAQIEHPEWKEKPWLALRWLYAKSPHEEGTAFRYPVYAQP